jgi:hypothetical protein
MPPAHSNKRLQRARYEPERTLLYVCFCDAATFLTAPLKR